MKHPGENGVINCSGVLPVSVSLIYFYFLHLDILAVDIISNEIRPKPYIFLWSSGVYVMPKEGEK